MSRINSTINRSGLTRLGAGTALVLSLGACGGGGDSAPAAPPPAATVAQAAADSYTIGWNDASTLKVLDNDTVSGATASLSVDVAPKNGNAVVSGTTLVYTPNPGFFGEDSLSYKLSVGTSSNSAAVKLVIETALTLQGAVSDGPIANATVQASVGSKTFSATADASGKYSLPIKTSIPNDFITLTATGSGSQSQVVLTSLVGEASSLAKAAKDGKLSSDQKPSLDVSHLSAAQAGLISQAGKLPGTDAELSSAVQKLSGQSVLDTAALVKLIVDQGVALPTGLASTRDLLNSADNLAVFQAVQRQGRADQIEAAREATRTDSQLSKAPPTPSSGGTDVSLLYTYGEESGASAARRLTLRNDGTGTELSDQLRSLKWTLGNRELVVRYDVPIEQILEADSAFIVAGTTQSVAVKTKVVFSGLRLADIGPEAGLETLGSVTTTAHATDLEGADVGVPNVGIREISAGEVMRRHPATLPALKASDFSVGTRVAGLFSAPFVAEQGREAQDVLKFTTASQAVFERSGESVNWRIADGHLQIDLANTSMRYTALGKGALGEDRWLIEQLNANGGATAIREIGVVPVQALNLDRAFWVRKWQSDIGASAAEPIVFRFREDALSAATSTPRGMASVPIDFRRYWHRLDDGRIEIVSARNPDCIVFRPDGSPGPVACVLTQRRSWTPVAQQGKTTWVLQNGPVLTGQPETAATWRLVALTQARGN